MKILLSGAPTHTRTLSVGLYADGSDAVAVRGEIVDLRKRGLIPMAESWQTAGPIHQMRVAARLDAEHRITAISADQPHVAVEPSEGTDGECCRDPVARIEALAGTRLDDAYVKRLGAAIGGPLGCSHVLTLAQLLGATASTALAEDAERFPAAKRAEGQRWFERNLSVDGLETEDGALALSAQLADVHFAPTIVQGDRGLARHREIRVAAHVALDTMQIDRIEAARRETTPDAAGRWEPCDVAFLAGHSALGGVAKTVFTTCDAGPLRDVLLNLAPTVIQCIPSLESSWERWRDAQRASLTTPERQPMAGGGMVDSCYMWRRDGGLQRKLAARRAGEPQA
jgi:hypothetical protein